MAEGKVAIIPLLRDEPGLCLLISGHRVGSLIVRFLVAVHVPHVDVQEGGVARESRGFIEHICGPGAFLTPHPVPFALWGILLGDSIVASTCGLSASSL